MKTTTIHKSVSLKCQKFSPYPYVILFLVASIGITQKVLPVNQYTILTKENTQPKKTVLPDSLLVKQYSIKGDSCGNAFNLTAAISWYTKGYDLEKTPAIARRLIQCYSQRGQYEKAKQIYSQIPNDSLNHSDWRMEYKLYKELVEVDSMILVGKRIVEKYPFDGEILSSLAARYNDIKQPDSALQYTENYVTNIDSTNTFVNAQRAYAYYLKEENIKALETYNKMLNSGYKQSSVYYYAGICYARCNSTLQAYHFLENAMKLDTEKNPYIVSQLGLVAGQAGFDHDAITYLTKSIEMLKPNDAYMFRLHDKLSDAYFSRHQFSDCIKALKIAQTYNPNSIYSLYKIARTYDAMKSWKQAKTYYLRFINKISKEDNPTPILIRFRNGSEERLKFIKKELFFKQSSRNKK